MRGFLVDIDLAVAAKANGIIATVITPVTIKITTLIMAKLGPPRLLLRLTM